MADNDVIYMFAMSLDGFIARENGAFDWLESYPPADFGFDEFLASITGVVMGRGTYDAVRTDGAWDYEAFPVVVATTREIDDLPTNAQAMAGSPAGLLANLRERGADGRIWILGGGDVADQFMQAGLLDIVEIGTIPVVLGIGIPAFGKASDSWLDLQFVKMKPNSAIHTQYKVRR